MLTLEQLAAEAVQRHPSDRNAATQFLAKRIAKTESLKQEALYRLSRTLVNEMSRALHFAHMRRKMPELAQKVRDNLGGLLQSWSLPSGIVLADATRSDLAIQIGQLQGMKRGIEVRIRFLESIYSRLKDDKQKVSDVLTSEEAEKLFAEAESEVVNG